jgi:hypothetical protein
MSGGGLGATTGSGASFFDVGWPLAAATLIAVLAPTSQEIARERLGANPVFAALGGLVLAAVLL